MIKAVTGRKRVNLHAKSMDQDQTAQMEQTMIWVHSDCFVSLPGSVHLGLFHIKSKDQGL